MSYGDDRNLAKGYPYMKQWLAFAEQTIEDGLYFSSANGKDWGLGDWLAPKGVDVKKRESIDLVCNGATAVWESWNGERSRLHNCYNGIGSWFYQALGGIIPTQPGYRRVSICPQTPEGITWTEVAEETPYRNFAGALGTEK